MFFLCIIHKLCSCLTACQENLLYDKLWEEGVIWREILIQKFLPSVDLHVSSYNLPCRGIINKSICCFPFLSMLSCICSWSPRHLQKGNFGELFLLLMKMLQQNMEQIYILWIMDQVSLPSQPQICILLTKYVYVFQLHAIFLSRCSS